MSALTDVRPDSSASPPGRRRRRWAILAGTVVLGLVAVVVGGLVVEFSRDVPQFPSLTDHPDPALHGTVAYVDASGCVRVVAASGRFDKQVYCLPPDSGPKAAGAGKTFLTGPQLVWLADGRLEVTMFQTTVREKLPPSYTSGWQKIVDVRTGAVTDVASPPDEPNLTTRQTVNPSGEKVTATSDDQSGRIKVTLTSADGDARTLLSARGPGSYTYGLTSAFWAPNWEWVAADDGRILVITTGTKPVTRVLVEQHSQALFDDARAARFAVTGADLLQ